MLLINLTNLHRVVLSFLCFGIHHELNNTILDFEKVEFVTLNFMALREIDTLCFQVLFNFTCNYTICVGD